MKVEGCGVRVGRRMGSDRGVEEEEGDNGGEGRELFKNSMLGLNKGTRTEKKLINSVSKKII